MKTVKGFSLVEMMIGLVIITIAAIGVFVMMGRASSTAAIEQEQRQLGLVVDDIQRQYVSASNYNGVSALDIVDNQTQGVRTQGNELVSEFNTPIVIRPATIVNAHDAFDVVYQQLKSSQCVNLVPAVSNRSHSIFIGSNTQSIQNINTGRITNEAEIASQCAEFNGTVVFRFFSPRNSIASTGPGACSCIPSNEARTESCPPGQSGSLTQSRSSTCTGGTPSCREEVWSSWTTTSSTCTPDVADAVTPDVLVPVSECTPATDVRNRACPTGQAGVITDQRTSTCASVDADPVWSAWSESSSSCAPIAANAVCQGQTQRQTSACPSGLRASDGSTNGIVRERSQICASASDTNPTWTDWLIVENTCTGSQSWTCQPQRYERVYQYNCNSGYYGGYNGGPLLQDQYNNSICDSATATDRQTPWINFNPVRGTCTACPIPSTRMQWVNRSAACPTGSAGSNTWQAEQRQVTSYNCPSGTRTLPAPDISAWVDTGTRRNVVDNCTSCPGPETDTQTQSVACPNGQTGVINQQRTRSRSYNCSGAGSWGAWSGWGAWTETSNTCSLPACDGTLAGNARNYMARYVDLYAAFGPTNYQGALNHWNANGYFEGRQSCWGPPAATCVVPAPETGVETTTDSRNVNCPSTVFDGFIVQHQPLRRTRTRSASCPDPYGAPVWGAWSAWSGWAAQSGWVDVDNRCSIPACSGDFNNNARNYMARYPDILAAYGATNYNGAFSHWNAAGYFEGRQSCWGAPAATCSPTAPYTVQETQVVNRNVGCAAGQTGAHMQNFTQRRDRTRSSTCPNPHGSPVWNEGAWGAWYDISGGTTTSNTCANPATCVVPAPQTEANVWQESRTVACPTGQTGTHTQQRAITDHRQRSATCPNPYGSPVWGAYGAWYRVGEGPWNTTSNTCVAAGTWRTSSSGYYGEGPATFSRRWWSPSGEMGSFECRIAGGPNMWSCGGGSEIETFPYNGYVTSAQLYAYYQASPSTRWWVLDTGASDPGLPPMWSWTSCTPGANFQYHGNTGHGFGADQGTYWYECE